MYFKFLKLLVGEEKKQILSLKINILISWNKIFNVQQRLSAWRKQASLKSEV